MNIDKIRHSKLKMAVELKYDIKSVHRIRRFWEKDIDKKHEGIVYFITVNDEIVKIGGSSNTIGKLVGQYLINLESRAEPRENRFCLHLRILSHLIKGDSVKYYFIPVQQMICEFEGLLGDDIETYHNEFRIVESTLINQYYELNGDVPGWNNCEGKIGWSKEIIAIFDEREMKMKTGDPNFFNYDEFISNYEVGLT